MEIAESNDCHAAATDVKTPTATNVLPSKFLNTQSTTLGSDYAFRQWRHIMINMMPTLSSDPLPTIGHTGSGSCMADRAWIAKHCPSTIVKVRTCGRTTACPPLRALRLLLFRHRHCPHPPRDNNHRWPHRQRHPRHGTPRPRRFRHPPQQRSDQHRQLQCPNPITRVHMVTPQDNSRASQRAHHYLAIHQPPHRPHRTSECDRHDVKS